MAKFIQCDKNKRESVLKHWQEVFARDKTAQADERELFKARERAYRGVKGEDAECYVTPEGEELSHGYNIIYENIEAQVDGSVYPVKVTALHQRNEKNAKKVEHRLNSITRAASVRNDVDLAERVVPTQGGTYWHGEWDNEAKTHTTCGDFVLKQRFPINIIPQKGANSVDEMQHIFMELGMEKSYVEKTYDVKLKEESEEEPEARSAVGDSVPAEDFVTVRIGYFRHESGSIGKVAWCGDTLLYYSDDYEAKYLYHCENCGATLSVEDFEGDDEEKAESFFSKVFGGKKKHSKEPVCTKCGGNKWKYKAVEKEVLTEDYKLPNGTFVPAGTEIPVYKPRILPFVLQKSVSAANELLGLSDADTLEEQQSKINFACRKIDERIDASRPFVTLPPDLSVEPTNGINYIRPDSNADGDIVRVDDVRFDISPFIAMKNDAYQEARNLIGITDSYQGRYDSSAKSGIAKQSSAAQAAGRLASKRNMKATAFADIYKMAFKFFLAYDDDVREVIYRDENGKDTYEKVSRFDFLSQDENGEWYFDDEYLFECDMSLVLEQDRVALWEQSSTDYAAGLYGQPGTLDALIMLWKRRVHLHYPLASETLTELEAQKAAQAVPATPTVPTIPQGMQLPGAGGGMPM